MTKLWEPRLEPIRPDPLRQAFRSMKSDQVFELAKSGSKLHDNVPKPKADQMFIINMDTLTAVTEEAAEAIIADLKELDLYCLPYEYVTLRFRTDDICKYPERHGRPLGPAHWVDVQDVNLKGEPPTLIFGSDGCPEYKPYCFCAVFTEDAAQKANKTFGEILIAVLATRNVQKDIKSNKRAKLGIGKKTRQNKYSYITTISLPKHMEDDEDNPAKHGASKAPHLRRGHIRHQHYGPGNMLLKKIWIKPMFVNADQGFVNSRKAYNVSL